MKKSFKILLPIIILICLSGSLRSQESAYYEPDNDYAGWNVALMTGISQFYGDVSQYNFFTKLNGESKLSWSLMIGKEFSPLVTLRGQVLGGSLVSYQDTFDDGRAANLFLDTRYFEIGGNARFNLGTLWLEDYSEKRWEIYGVAGLSFATWDALLRDNITMTEIDPAADKTHLGIVFPIGLGFEYQVYENWHLFTEWTYRFVASEKVDLVQGGFSSDPILNVGFGVNYKFGVSDKKVSFDDEPRDTEAETAPYRRLNFEGPDILEFSSDNTCTNTQIRFSDNDDASNAGNQDNGSDDSSQGSPGGMLTDEGKDMNTGGQEYGSTSQYDNFLGQGVTFSVQILAVSKAADIQPWKRKYSIYRKVMEYHRNGLYRYIAGNFNTYSRAASYANDLRRRGIYDAFVVVFRNGEKVRLTPEMKRN